MHEYKSKSNHSKSHLPRLAHVNYLPVHRSRPAAMTSRLHSRWVNKPVRLVASDQWQATRHATRRHIRARCPGPEEAYCVRPVYHVVGTTKSPQTLGSLAKSPGMWVLVTPASWVRVSAPCFQLPVAVLRGYICMYVRKMRRLSTLVYCWWFFVLLTFFVVLKNESICNGNGFVLLLLPTPPCVVQSDAC